MIDKVAFLDGRALQGNPATSLRRLNMPNQIATTRLDDEIVFETAE